MRSDHAKARWLHEGPRAQQGLCIMDTHSVRTPKHLCSWLSCVMRSVWGLMGVPPSTLVPELRLPTAPTSTGSGPPASESAKESRDCLRAASTSGPSGSGGGVPPANHWGAVKNPRGCRDKAVAVSRPLSLKQSRSSFWHQLKSFSGFGLSLEGHAVLGLSSSSSEYAQQVLYFCSRALRTACSIRQHPAEPDVLLERSVLLDNKSLQSACCTLMEPPVPIPETCCSAAAVCAFFEKAPSGSTSSARQPLPQNISCDTDEADV